MNKEEALKELIYLSKIIERHNKLYYQNDSPEISDSEYDRLRARNEDLEKYFSSSLGALRIIKDGWETEAIPEIGRKAKEKIDFFAKNFGIHS